MADFEQRLQQAIDRGTRQAAKAARDLAEQRLTEEELRRLHADFRLKLSEHIEHCCRKLADFLPGFRVGTVLGDGGWGAEAHRSDFGVNEKGERGEFYSRLEVSVRPYTPRQVIDLVAKGTVRNKEVLHRNTFGRLPHVDVPHLQQTVDQWVLEFAEKYSAKE